MTTGLIIFAFVTSHFLSHTFGVRSIDAMHEARRYLIMPWQTFPGLSLLYGALVTHALLGLYALHRRRHLRIPAGEAWQLALGLAIPLLLIQHAGSIRVGTSLYQMHSVLEASRWAGIPHASVCGGRSRCSTCRIRVFDTAAMLAPLGPVELRTLQRIAAPPNVRLACQLRPSVDVSVVPLVPAGPDLGSGALRFDAGVEGGRELPIAAMFVDMRGSTRLATGRLPYLTAGDRLQFDTDGSADDEKNIAACVLILHDPLVTGCATPGALGIENLDFRRIHRPE